MMLELQVSGCENINLVSPSHVVPQILAALVLAVEAGLRLPLVYNTGGYDSVATLSLLDGVVDIYMPDMKYADRLVGERLSRVPDYPARNREAVLEMHRQVGDLVLEEGAPAPGRPNRRGGIARRGPWCGSGLIPATSPEQPRSPTSWPLRSRPRPTST